MKKGSTSINAGRSLLRSGISAAAMLAVLSGVASAQDAPAATNNDVVVVTGYRASLQSALSVKRKADVMLDAINAEDIADFPDANLAESLQRIPGISIDRDNGEGRVLTVRGLGADFTRVRINGLEALSTAGSNDAGSSPNRSRAFDFNTFASELFNSLKVRKTASAETDEGSLGATIDLITGRPFDYKGNKFAMSLQDAYYQNGGKHNPRVTGLVSRRWADGKLGFLASVAYSERTSENDQYRRGVGQSDYTYRGTTWAGLEDPRRAGFSAPVGTTFLTNRTEGTTAAPNGTTSATAAITNPAVIAAQTGSDPAAYALLHPGCTGVSAPSGCNNSLVKIPALGSIEQQNLYQERLGITSSFQAQLAPKTRLSIDGLYSRFENESTINQVSSVGLNRNNTNATYNTATSATSIANKRGLYPGTCTAAAETPLAAGQDCGGSLNGTTPAFATGSNGAAAVFGTNIFSVNKFNLDPYDYFNNPLSVGYVASPDGIGFRDKLIGRPATDVLAAHVTNGVADYLQLRNVDWRSAADRGHYTTEFKQLSLNLTHEFTDKLRGDFTYGASESYNYTQGLLVEFNRMDSPETFTYDERAGGNMPVFDPGFDASDPTKWGIVKGFSGMRHYQRFVTNAYKGFKADFTYDINDNFSLKFGGTSRIYTFKTRLRERNNDLLNPTEKEMGVSVASLGNVFNFGDGLDDVTPVKFFAPSIEKFDSVIGFTCDCINKFGDWRLTDKRNGGRENFRVREKSSGLYAQLNFNLDVLGRNMFGNVGVRQADTELTSFGTTSAGRPITGHNDYKDTLPSLNIAWEVMDDLYIRAGASKVMARPLLGNLSPSVTAINVPNTGATTGGTLTVGNPKLQPFRANAYDLSAEWYFTKGALVSLAVFKKDIGSYPQTVLYSAPLSNFLSAEDIATLKAQFTNANQIAYLDGNYEFTARQFRDAPGGELKGWEFSYQQDFTFLPWYFKNTGVQFNATHIDSELLYILDPGTATVAPTYGTGPWLGASPDAINFTLYYETPVINARVSVAQREGYYTTYPIAAGSCAAGLNADLTTPCDSPLVNDFTGSKSTMNVDFSFTYNPTKNLALTLEGLNMTDQKSERYSYIAQPVVSQYGSTGRQFTLGVRYKY